MSQAQSLPDVRELRSICTATTATIAVADDESKVRCDNQLNSSSSDNSLIVKSNM